MNTIVILGFGNLATQLYYSLKEVEKVQVVQLYNRSIQKLEKLKNEVEITDSLLEIKEADTYIIALSDDAISSISELLIEKDGLIVHTSGSVGLHALGANKRRGVLYPLQTFSKDRKTDFRAVPICIEAERESDLALLHQLASKISDSVFEISTEQRKSLHLAAVFVNNFTNHLYHIGNEICKENQLPFDMLKPLILETAQKIDSLSPYNAQTGPAKRNDVATLEKQLHQLQNNNHKEIYSLLSESIKSTYGKKL